MKAIISYRVTDKVVGGRPKGLSLRDDVLRLLQGAPPDAVLDLDLSAVETLDFSAADELIAGLLARVASGELGERRFYLTGVGESARESIRAVLDLKKRVCLEVMPDGAARVIGRLSAPHRETLDFVLTRGAVTAGDVAGRFWSEPNMTAATNRLNALAAAGLVLRILESAGRRGSRFLYQSYVQPPSESHGQKGDES